MEKENGFAEAETGKIMMNTQIEESIIVLNEERQIFIVGFERCEVSSNSSQ